MNEVKAVLFDADGVTIIPSEPFSMQYARAKNFDPKTIEPFFAGDFQQALIGKADLKELIKEHRDIWHLEGSADDLLSQWFAAENHPNTKLVKLIKQLRKRNLHCYLATNQEKYRTAFIRKVMFPATFDGIFSSAEIGAVKPSRDFFEAVLAKLATQNISARQVAYFDDNERSVEAAKVLGIHGYIYTNIGDVEHVI